MTTLLLINLYQFYTGNQKYYSVITLWFVVHGGIISDASSNTRLAHSYQMKKKAVSLRDMPARFSSLEDQILEYQLALKNPFLDEGITGMSIPYL